MVSFIFVIDWLRNFLRKKNYKMKNEPFVIERTFNAPVAKVWKAITDKEDMKVWYFTIKDFKPEVGFEFQFTGSDNEVSFLHLCKVTAVEVNKKLAYSWTYAEYEGYSVVTIELFPEGDKTRLRLTHEGLESFPANNKSFTRASFTQGWNQIIGTNLKDFLEN